MSLNQTAEIRFKYVLDGDGFRSVATLTGEVLKLAAAEESAIGRAKALGREMEAVRTGGTGVSAGVGGQSRFGPDAAAPRGPDAQYDRSAPRPGLRPEEERLRGDTQLIRAIESLTSALLRQTATPSTMMVPAPGTPAAQGRDLVASLLAGEGVAKYQQKQQRADERQVEDFRAALDEKRQRDHQRANVGRAAFLGGTVAAVGLGGELARLNATPFMDSESKFWSFARKLQIPGLNIGVGDLRDIQQALQKNGKGEDTDKQMRYILERQHQVTEFDLPREEYHTRRWFGRQEAGRGFDAATGPARLAPLESMRRDTVEAQRTYDEERRIMPARDRVTMTRREEIAAEGKLHDYDRHIDRLRGDIEAATAKAEELRKEAEKHPNDDGGFGRQRLYAQAVVQDQRAAALGRLALKAGDDRQQAEIDLTGVRGERRTAERGEATARLGIFREREEVSRSQAASLALAGPGGRAQAEYAMQILKEVGIADTPGEIVSMARPLFGKTIDKMAEAEGQRFVPQFQAMAPGEYRDTVPEIRKEVDRAEAALRDREQNDLPERLLEMFRVFSGITTRDNDLVKQLERVVRQMETEMRLQSAVK